MLAELSRWWDHGIWIRLGVAVVVALLLGAAAILLSIPGVRELGASLLASAGVAGLALGLAAKDAAPKASRLKPLLPWKDEDMRENRPSGVGTAVIRVRQGAGAGGNAAQAGLQAAVAQAVAKL